jgi:hypothetical protein
VADWPIGDDGDNESRRPAVTRQRATWQRQRRRWCQAHGIDLHALIAEGQAQSVYAHLIATATSAFDAATDGQHGQAEQHWADQP